MPWSNGFPRLYLPPIWTWFAFWTPSPNCARSTGNARVTHQGNTFEGAKVEYNLDSRRVDASSEGDKRVRLVIPAKNAEQASEDAEPEEQDNGEPAQDAPAAQPDNAETP